MQLFALAFGARSLVKYVTRLPWQEQARAFPNLSGLQSRRRSHKKAQKAQKEEFD